MTSLQQASADPALPDATRNLLRDAISALDAANTASRAEHARYRTLFDAVPDPVTVLSWDGTVLDVNKAAVASYQRQASELIGQPIELLNPELPRDHMAPVHDALSRGDSYVVEVTNMRADGSRFPVEVHSANLMFEGKPSLVAVARDLSSHHEAQLRYRELLDAVDKGIIVRDADGHVIQVNPAAIRILGLKHADTQHLSLDESLSSTLWQTFDENGNEVLDDDGPATHALRTGKILESTIVGFYNLRTRQLKWLSVTCVPQFAPGADKPHQVLSMFSDVTTLKRDSAMFERVEGLAHIGGWEWDVARDRLYLSEESGRILGCHAHPRTMGEMLDCLLDSEHRRLQEAIQQALPDGAFDLDLQGRHADGHAFWARMIGSAAGGQPAQRVSGTLQDITIHRQAEETLRVQARTDPLTGLLNRDAILAELGQRLSDESMAQIAVLYIDLDRFKVVNDVLGHNAGDELLVTAARRIADAVGTEGLIARFGGDEFLVVCNIGDDPQRPPHLAGRILAVFGDSFRFGDEEFSITASIGIACAPQDGNRPQALIQNADAAMYDSKRRMRNGWQAFTAELAQSQQERLQVETNLRRATDNGEFHLVYQPQIELRSGRIVAAEALIRWHNQQFGIIPPDHFIGHAEVTGDIVRIGNWVLREACRQIREWRDAGLGVVRVAVNVSYRQFLGEDLAGTVAATLHEFGLPGSALELEFTERILIEDAPDTLESFAQLRNLGVHLTIDDFGEGYSALNYLRRLPIHGLKLSQLFLQGVPHNRSDVAVCNAVAGIARSMGLSLVAEGIETDAQRRFLLKIGVSVGQGFLFARGLLPQEFALRLQATPAPVPLRK